MIILQTQTNKDPISSNLSPAEYPTTATSQLLNINLTLIFQNQYAQRQIDISPSMTQEKKKAYSTNIRKKKKYSKEKDKRATF